MKLDEIPVHSLPKTAPRTIKRCESLGIHTYQDLLMHFPFRYEDYSRIIPIREMFLEPVFNQEDADADQPLLSTGKMTIRGTVASFDDVRTRRGMTIQKVRITDDTGTAELSWFNQMFLRQIMTPGTHISVSGHVRNNQGKPVFQPEEYEVIDSGDSTTMHTGRIVPVYPQTKGLSSRTLREKIWYVLASYGDMIVQTLPDDILNDYNLTKDDKAYSTVHFPESADVLRSARDRIAFDELFIVQLSSKLIKKEWQKERVGNKLTIPAYKDEIHEFIDSQPFTLTGAQQRATEEILEDLKSAHPMNRLLQGDVGSGKTIVAAIAAYAAHLNGYKTLVMAPTEILAQQHYVSLGKTFSTLRTGKQPGISLLTSKSKPSKKDVESSSIIVGTHALITDKTDFSQVGLVIVDEQHKFGVVQRSKLEKKGASPHLLSMTATPIPRTVALTLYGELDLSLIDELPHGRLKVKTYVVPPKKRRDAYEWIRREINAHNSQTFIVCPLIDESEAESLQSVRAANVEYEQLSSEIFPDLTVGLLHGRQKSAEKDEIMQKFAKGAIDILVSTPVVEVGIDIPNATIIVIEAAERFGLAQLHQLRGRVGRSDKQSYCLLFTEKNISPVKKRLNMFAGTNSGFRLAEYDLQHRGSGNIFGTRQHGLSELKIASLMDAPLIESTQNAVHDFVSKYSLDDHPALKKRLEAYQINHIARN